MVLRGDKALVANLCKVQSGVVPVGDAVFEDPAFDFDRRVWWLREKWLRLPKHEATKV